MAEPTPGAAEASPHPPGRPASPPSLYLCLLVVLLLQGLLSPPTHAQSTSSPPGTRIITAEELRQAGATRLADIFALLDDWDAATIEGYSWEVAAGGLAPLQASNWTLLVDGQPVDVGLLDSPNLNAFPLLLEEIAYVEAISRPALAEGMIAPAGALHLHTRQPERGVSVRGTVAAGNEIGDPGPYRYTNFASPNIDRIGPTLGAAASVAGRAGHARLTFKSDEHHATDTQIEQRVRHLYANSKNPRLLLTSAGLDAALQRSGTHHLQAGYFRLQDLRFVEAMGLEVPADQRFYHAGLSGDFDPGAPAGVRYRLSYAASDLDPRVNRAGVDFNFRQNRMRGHMEVRMGARLVQGTLGLGLEHLQSTTPYPLATNALLIPQGYARLGARAGVLAADVALHALGADGEVGYMALAALWVRPGAINTLALHAATVRQPYALANSLWYWSAQGYGFLADQQATVTLPADFSSPISYTADLAWTIRPDDRLAVTLSGAYRRFLGQVAAVHSFAFDPATEGFAVETDVRPAVAGQVAQAAAEVTLGFVPGLLQRFYYRYRRYPQVDEPFFLLWRNQPWHRFSYTARYVPLDRLSLYARLAYHSDAVWPAYGPADAGTGGHYPSVLPDRWRLDLTVQKRFWHDHLRASLSLRNALNAHDRTHPAGAINRMTLYFGVEAFVNGGG